MKGGGGDYIVKLDTYNDWIEKINANPEKQCQWIYNIIDNNAEQNRILYQNDNFILITEPTMNTDDILNTFHLLAFPKDKTIKSIRHLTQQHIPLLENMLFESKKFIKDNYNSEINNQVEAHFHYLPNVYLLHLHFELVNSKKKCRKPLREHSIIKVIENLKIDSNYYKKVIIDVLEKNE